MSEEAAPQMDPPRDLRLEYQSALRACSPKQRKWLKRTYEMAGQKWAACSALGYSTHTVWKWLRDEKIKSVVALQQELAELDHDLTRARILREYERLAFANVNEFRAPDGTRKGFPDFTDDMSAAIHEIEFDELGKPSKIKLHAKVSALDTLARIQGVLVDRSELTIKDAPAPVVRIVERAD
jgi:phage terminase small subunit